ncbi:hypothetical protein EUX98_g7019 [Antrodiella citrinella]|uniref:Uncharacterized protein n=1 Tax=Antrodiella citrinella TaxID=2447956 RepID=A0A4S4MV05_9APHY|nr:hypothetical protein EUX98_g7019 [Antrodiella citrinella]
MSSTKRNSTERKSAKKQSRKPYNRETTSRYARNVLGLHSTRPPAMPLSALYEDTLNRKNHRDCLLLSCKRYYPNIVLRHDFDILYLGSGLFNEDDSDFYAFSDKQFDLELSAFSGSRTAEERESGVVLEKYWEYLRETMEAPPSAAGIKPPPGEADVRIRPIPDSKYSMRLWGKHLEQSRQYCLDFVNTETGEAVDSPFEYELWTVPRRATPMVFCPSGRLYTLEETLGCSLEGSTDGVSKFLLFEGMACRLTRPGKKCIYFEVPVRDHPEDESDEQEHTIVF